MEGKIFWDKCALMTEEDVERLKDIPMKRESYYSEEPPHLRIIIDYKIDEEKRFYIFNVFTIGH